jgi:hypothetical protein
MLSRIVDLIAGDGQPHALQPILNPFRRLLGRFGRRPVETHLQLVEVLATLRAEPPSLTGISGARQLAYGLWRGVERGRAAPGRREHVVGVHDPLDRGSDLTLSGLDQDHRPGSDTEVF